MLQNFQSDTLLNIEHYVHEKTDPSGAMKSTGYRPPDLSCYVLRNLFMRCYIHSKISVVAAGDLAPRWHQDIYNHHDDVGGR